MARLHSGWQRSHSLPGGGGERGRVTEFTEDSRRRMELRFRESDWPQHRTLAFITLTWPRHFSADPTDWKRALRAWRSAYERRWGPVVGIWALEFQRRGAPHFHLAIAGPKGVPIDELREWNARTWYRIAGHGDERHLAQHSKPGHCKKARHPNELLGYLQKATGRLARELTKRRQKELPKWLTDLDGGAGRWWGLWRLENAAFNEPLNREEYRGLHRRARRLLKPRTRQFYVRSTRYVMRPYYCNRGCPRECAQPRHWMMRPRATKTPWRPDSRWIVMRDHSPTRWALSQVFYNLLLLIRGTRTARSSYARWHDISSVQLPLSAADGHAGWGDGDPEDRERARVAKPPAPRHAIRSRELERPAPEQLAAFGASFDATGATEVPTLPAPPLADPGAVPLHGGDAT